LENKPILELCGQNGIGSWSRRENGGQKIVRRRGKLCRQQLVERKEVGVYGLMPFGETEAGSAEEQTAEG